MVLADAVERGEVSLDTTVAAILPEHEGTPFGSITLEEMCTHTSGLPKLPRSVVTLRRILLFVLFGRDPRRHISAEAVLAAGARQKLHGRGQYRYSNLGGAIAGQLLAVAAGCDYSTLLKERPCRPLGIRSTTVAERGAWEAGWSAQSRRCQPWLPDGTPQPPAFSPPSRTCDSWPSRCSAILPPAQPPCDRSVSRRANPDKQACSGWSTRLDRAGRRQGSGATRRRGGTRPNLSATPRPAGP